MLGAGRGPVKTFALRMMAPVVIKLATGLHRASDEAGHEDIELLPERLDQIDAWIAEGVLGGEHAQRRRLPDRRQRLCVAAVRGSRARSSRGGPRPCSRAASSPDYVGHLGPVVPAEWMDDLRAAAGDPPRSTSGASAAGSAPAGPGERRRPLRHCSCAPACEMATTARLTRAERSAQTRRELLAAAQRHFFEAGYHATTRRRHRRRRPATRRAPSTRRSAARPGSSSRCSTTSSSSVWRRRGRSSRSGDSGSEASLQALAEQPVEERDARFLLLSIEFWVHAAREPALLEAFSERYRRLRASLAELAPQDSPLGSAALGARDAGALQRVRARAPDRSRRRAWRPHGRRAGAAAGARSSVRDRRARRVGCAAAPVFPLKDNIPTDRTAFVTIALHRDQRDRLLRPADQGRDLQRARATAGSSTTARSPTRSPTPASTATSSVPGSPARANPAPPAPPPSSRRRS